MQFVGEFMVTWDGTKKDCENKKRLT